MPAVPEPPPASSPFGSPGSGWNGASGPFESPSSGGGGRRKLVVVVLLASAVAIAVVVASVFMRDDSPSDTARSDRPSNESVVPLESDPSVPLSEATLAPSTTPEPSSPSTQGAPLEPAPSTEITTLPDEVDPTSQILLEGDRVGLVVDEIAVARGADPLRVLKMAIYPE